MHRAWLLVPVLAACDGPGTPPDDPSVATDTGSDTGAPSPTGEPDPDPDPPTGSGGTSAGGTTEDGTWGGLPDPWAAMDPGHCAGGAYYDPALPVAVSYFVGDLTVSGGLVTGTETWVLLFNATAEAGIGAPSCEVVWEITGTEQDPGACAGCTFGVTIDAAVDPDPARTTCPGALFQDDLQFSVSYDVLAAPDGTTAVSFASSGNHLGGWYWAGDRYTYLTDPSCMIF